MSQMFENASAFNQDISAWTINTSISPNPPTDFANGSAITKFTQSNKTITSSSITVTSSYHSKYTLVLKIYFWEQIILRNVNVNVVRIFHLIN